MNNKMIFDLEIQLKNVLSEKRYNHVIGVAMTAASIYMSYGISELEDVFVSGLLHDCAKYINDDDFIVLCRNNNIPVTEDEIKAPYLLHAKYGAYLARTKYGISDEKILASIIYHTTGCPNMTFLEKVIFISDYIEPFRIQNTTPPLFEIRKIAFKDIDYAVYLALKNTLEYLQTNNMHIDKTTFEAFNYYKDLLKENNNDI